MSAGPSRTRTFLLKAGLPSAHVGVPETLTVAGRARLSACPPPPRPVAVASNTHLKFPCAFPRGDGLGATHAYSTGRFV